MIILLFFAFISGLVTIFAPCIWPLLPIILSSSTTSEKKKPLGITLGIISSFALFTLTLSYIVRIIPFDPNILRLFAVIVIGFLGLTLVIPRLSQILEGYVSRLSGKVGGNIQNRSGFAGGYVTGFALGIVWSPCAGPILATIATLAATRSVSIEIVLVTIAYVIGVGIPLLIFAQAGSFLFVKSRSLSKYTGVIQQVFGAVMILTALAIYSNYDKVLQAKLLDAFPSYTNFINRLESNPAVKNQLDTLRGNQKSDMKKVKETMPNLVIPGESTLPKLGVAPEFEGIEKWLNLQQEKNNLTMKELRGKVVLIDFWTYTCINCIRTLPHVTSWYEKYKDKGLVVIGIHTPEFEFEKKTENVEQAIRQYKIHYPVAQDNEYSTWQAYDNHYWPAKYLIDRDGNIRYFHFGEGEYETTEKNIQELLKESGAEVNDELNLLDDRTPVGRQTPETYLGSLRMDRRTDSEEGLPLHYFSLNGDWDIQPEYSESKGNSSLAFHFYASKVYLVMNPSTKGGQVRIFLDNKHVESLTLDTDRLYELIQLSEKGDHTLKLEFDPGIKAFAFTFG